MGNVGFRLVIVIIGDKILNCVIGKKLPEFAAKLGCQGLIVRQNQCRLIYICDDVCHRKCFAGAGYTKQDLLIQALLYSLCKPCNRLWLVAHRLVFRYQFELFHIGSQPPVLIFSQYTTLR